MPVDLGRTAMSEMKELELLGYQKATDHAIRKAMSYGLESKNAEKIRAITTARHFLSKSMARGASEEFKKATEMTSSRPSSRAKRTITAPPAPSRATTRRRPGPWRAPRTSSGAKRYADRRSPSRSAAALSDRNWSISGFLLADCCRMDIEPGLQAPATVFGATLKTPMVIPTRIISRRSRDAADLADLRRRCAARSVRVFKKLILAKATKGASATA